MPWNSQRERAYTSAEHRSECASSGSPGSSRQRDMNPHAKALKFQKEQGASHNVGLPASRVRLLDAAPDEATLPLAHRPASGSPAFGKMERSRSRGGMWLS